MRWLTLFSGSISYVSPDDALIRYEIIMKASARTVISMFYQLYELLAFKVRGRGRVLLYILYDLSAVCFGSTVHILTILVEQK